MDKKQNRIITDLLQKLKQFVLDLENDARNSQSLQKAKYQNRFQQGQKESWRGGGKN